MRKEHILIIVAAIFYGTIAPGGQLFLELGLSLFEIAFYRVFLISLILLPVVLIKPEYLVKKDKILFFAVYGLIGAFLELTQFGGIVLGIPVAIVILLLYTQPIWTIFFGKLMLNEKITLRKLASVALALIGVAILLGSWSTESSGSIAGIICSLLGGVFLSLWVVWGRKSGIDNQHYITTTIGWTGFSVVWLLVLFPLLGLVIQQEEILRFSPVFLLKYWFYLCIFAFVGGVIPHLLFYRGIQNVSASVAGVILLLEPVSATALAAYFFDQAIGLHILSGGFLILISNYLIIHEPTGS